MYRDISEFISVLEREGELLRISARVDPVLEIAEITDRMAKSPGGGKALLFEDTGTDFPVLTNMMGSDRRIALALGVDSIDDISSRLDSLLGKALASRDSFMDKLRVLPLLGEVSRWLPRSKAGRGKCQQVVLTGQEARLGMLPILKCWPHDGGRFITLPLVHTADPETGARNVGMYRMQVTGDYTTGMHWHMHKTGERHYRACRGGRMPVSVCLGGDPVYTYAATAPMPDNMDEYLLAGFLRRRPVKLIKCLTNDLQVPDDCDFVIEGYVDTAREKFLEGPFGDHTGFYSLEDHYPEFHVTAITHRRNAVYPATVVGIPPQEDLYIAKATERIFLAPIRLAMQPEIKDLFMPAAGVAHNLALVSIDKTYPGQGFKVAGSMWGAGQMMFNKILLVAPSGTNIRDARMVGRLLRNADIREDVLLSKGVLDVLDHATATPGTGGKMAMDLTADRADKDVILPPRFYMPEWAGGVDISFAGEFGVLIVRSLPGKDVDANDFINGNNISGLNFLVVTDTATADMSAEGLLWFAAANIDPGRDVSYCGETMVVDARSKTPFREGYPERIPNVVVSDAATIALVDSRWGEYGIGDFIASPSVRYARLVMSGKAEVDAK